MARSKKKSSVKLEANIIWKPYENDEIFPRKNSTKNNSENNLKNNQKVDIKFSNTSLTT